MLKSDILKTLKKYGFYSLNRAPYLYQGSEGVGIYFSWPSKHFRNLDRVLFFDNVGDMDEEVFKYYWYMHNKKEDIDVSFDRLDIINPTVTYLYKNHEITASDMKDFNTFKATISDPNEELRMKELERTANILLLILKEKFKSQNDINVKVNELSETLRKLSNTFNKKLKEYNKDKESVEDYEVLFDNNNIGENVIVELNRELSNIDNVNDLINFINNLLNILKDLDSNEAYLQNIYLYNRYPYEIEDMKKKISIVEDGIKLKKRLFSKKQNVDACINEIDNQSEVKKMLNINVYVDNEKKAVEEKYNGLLDKDLVTVGDYLVNLENLDIVIPERYDNGLVIMPFNEDSIKYLYSKLDKKEKCACTIASSFLKDCLNEIKKYQEIDVKDIMSKADSEVLNDAYQILDNYINAKVRVKYFSLLKMNNMETFVKSLLEVLNILNDINMRVENSFYAYYNNIDSEITPIYLKNIFNYSYKTSYIGQVLKDSYIYYSPVEIVKNIDITEYTELVARENDCYFLLNSRLIHKVSDNSIKVCKYEKDKIVNKKEYVVVNSVKEKNSCTYYEDIVYNKDMEGYDE